MRISILYAHSGALHLMECCVLFIDCYLSLKASAEAAIENISSSCIWSFLQKLIHTRLIFICFGLLFISSCRNFFQCSKVFVCFDGEQTVSIEISMSLKAIGHFAPSNGVQKLQIAFSCDGIVRAQKIKHTKTSLVL